VPRIRNAAAAARDVLATLAAEQLGVAGVQLIDGDFHADNGRSIPLTSSLNCIYSDWGF
jgi:hypothetical protein